LAVVRKKAAFKDMMRRLDQVTILRLQNLQLQRQRGSRLESFFKVEENIFVLKSAPDQIVQGDVFYALVRLAALLRREERDGQVERRARDLEVLRVEGRAHLLRRHLQHLSDGSRHLVDILRTSAKKRFSQKFTSLNFGRNLTTKQRTKMFRAMMTKPL
jgi:hypothetical protein